MSGRGVLRVVFADDEKMARRRLRRLLEALGDVAILAEERSGEAVAAHLDPAEVDVALLDIDMPGEDGLSVARLAARRGVPVIFVTAHAEHAVGAFERGAVHYLLKPIDLDRLDAALERVRQLRADRDDPLARVALTVGDEVHLVDVTAISHAVFDGNLVTVHTDEREYLSSESLQVLERKLGGALLRVHRRVLVSLSHLDRLRPLPSGGYTAVMRSGAEVPVSRQAARDLRKRLL